MLLTVYTLNSSASLWVANTSDYHTMSGFEFNFHMELGCKLGVRLFSHKPPHASDSLILTSLLAVDRLASLQLGLALPGSCLVPSWATSWHLRIPEPSELLGPFPPHWLCGWEAGP